LPLFAQLRPIGVEQAEETLVEIRPVDVLIELAETLAVTGMTV